MRGDVRAPKMGDRSVDVNPMLTVTVAETGEIRWDGQALDLDEVTEAVRRGRTRRDELWDLLIACRRAKWSLSGRPIG